MFTVKIPKAYEPARYQPTQSDHNLEVSVERGNAKATDHPGHTRPLGWFEAAARRGFTDEAT